MKRTGSIKTIICMVGMIAILVMGIDRTGVRAEEEAADKPTASLSVDVLSQYIWRGFALSSDSAVIQPSVTLGYKGFAFNVWGNLDTDQNAYFDHSLSGAKWNETDLTLSYSRELFKNFTGTVGTIYYALTNAEYDSIEVFAGASYAFPWFTVGLTGYREVYHAPGWWVQLDITRSFPLPCNLSLDLGASLGYLDLEDSDYADFHSATLNAALKIPVHKYVTITPKIGYAFPLTSGAGDVIKAGSFDREDNHVFGGVNVTASF